MSESWPEQKIRLQSMAYGDTTWDLSDNDTDAITEALRRIDAVERNPCPMSTGKSILEYLVEFEPQAAQPICPVCYQPLESLPENHTICPNCKTQFGYDDVGHSYEELRNMWQAAQPGASPTPEQLATKHCRSGNDFSNPYLTLTDAAAAIREALAAQSEAEKARLAAQKAIIATLGEGKAAAEQRADKAEGDKRSARNFAMNIQLPITTEEDLASIIYANTLACNEKAEARVMELEEIMADERSADKQVQEIIGKYQDDADYMLKHLRLWNKHPSLATAGEIGLLLERFEATRQIAPKVNSCSDCQAELESMTDHFAALGLISQESETNGISEIIWRNARADALAASLRDVQETLSETSRALSNILAENVNAIRPTQREFGKKMVDESVALLTRLSTESE